MDHQIYQVLKNKEAHTADKDNLGFISDSAAGFTQTLRSHSATGSSQTLCSHTSLLSTFAKVKSFLGKKNSPVKFCTSQCKTEFETFYHMLSQAPFLDCISTDSVDFQLLVNKKKMQHRHQPWHKHCKSAKLSSYPLRKLKILKKIKRFTPENRSYPSELRD